MENFFNFLKIHLLSTVLILSMRVCAADRLTVTLDSHPDWITLRERALAYAREHLENPGEGWQNQLCCVPKTGIVWTWDSCFMALYAGYTPENLNGLGNLDNLYSLQRADGYISMAYTYATREETYGSRINPPLFAWVEWLYARRTGDCSRLPRAYEAARRLYDWIQTNRRRPCGLYWFRDTGSSGMDNAPRSGSAVEDPRGSDVCFVDLACQQALAARSLAKIAAAIGRTNEVSHWEKEAASISALVNATHWCERDGFYHDTFDARQNKLAAKTAAAFWAIVSGVADDRQVAKLAAHLTNPNTFGTRHPVPSLAKDDLNYRADGGYWLGSVWPPIEYMVCCGLRTRGHRALAREIAKRHLACQAELLGRKDYDSIWECYSPEFKSPARNRRGDLVRPAFIGWSGIGPFLLLVEDVIGLDIDALNKKVTWHLFEDGRQGLTAVPFNGGTIDLEATVTGVGAFAVRAKGNRPFVLDVIAPDGVTRMTRTIEPGIETAFATDTAHGPMHGPLVYADEFNGDALDAALWQTYVPTFRGRTCGFYFSSDNVALSNGCLNLTARRLRPDELTAARRADGHDKWATAIVRSVRKFGYGYYETRAKGMRASVCNAFWLYDPLSDRPDLKFKPGSASEEIDIFEFFGKPAKKNVERLYFTTCHRMLTPYLEGTVNSGQTLLLPKSADTRVDFDFWADFHVYGFLWTEKVMVWYLDGREVFRRSNDYFTSPLHVTFDCEIMPNWSGLPEDVDLPAVYSVDYFRYYSPRVER